MPNYQLVLDETGNFNHLAPEGVAAQGSFVGGALLKDTDEATLRQIYRNAYQEVIHHEPPHDNALRAAMHYREVVEGVSLLGLDDWMAIAAAVLCELQENVVGLVRSQGRPAVISNNQHWWLEAVLAVVQGVISQTEWDHGSTLRIEVASRTQLVLGMVLDQSDGELWQQYHRALGHALGTYVHHSWPTVNAGVGAIGSPNHSYLLNLSDVCVAAMRCHLVNQWLPNTPTHGYSVRSRPLSISPNELLQGGRFDEAVRSLLASADHHLLAESEVDLFKEALRRLRQEKKRFRGAWEEILRFFDVMLARRGEDASVMDRLKPVVDALGNYLHETWPDQALRATCRLNAYPKFITFDSHRGAITSEWPDKFFSELAGEGGSLVNLADRWKAAVDVALAASQIKFNAYEFRSARDECEQLWEIHEAFRDAAETRIFTDTDDLAAGLVGTIGQSYAFEGDYDNALQHLQLDRQYTIEGTMYRAKADSYLITLHALNRRIDAMNTSYHHAYGRSLIAALSCPHFLETLDTWGLLDLLRAVCATETLHPDTIGANLLTNIPLDTDEGYPWPLVLKWYGFHLVLHGNHESAREYFQACVRRLIPESNDFTIRTLAISPLLILWGMGQDRARVRLNGLLEQLQGQSESFDTWKNEALPADVDAGALSLWDKVTMLPYYYS